MAVGGVIWASYAGPCYRAIAAGLETAVLDGSARAGRYNRPGECTLYMSSSPAGVAAAMTRYGSAARAVVRLAVSADRLVDLRDGAACGAHGIDPAWAKEDWIAALECADEPLSWRVADRAREIGACGLIDRSRRAPGEWHLILFRWNEAGAALVRVEEPTRE